MKATKYMIALILITVLAIVALVTYVKGTSEKVIQQDNNGRRI